MKYLVLFSRVSSCHLPKNVLPKVLSVNEPTGEKRLLRISTTSLKDLTIVFVRITLIVSSESSLSRSLPQWVFHASWIEKW